MKSVLYTIAIGFSTLALGAPAARADALDCSKQPLPITRMVCGDPTLSLLDEALAETYSTALETTLDPASFRNDESDWFGQAVLANNWYAERGLPVDKEALAAAYQTRIADLRRLAQLWRETRVPVADGTLATSCLVLPPYPHNNTCQVTSAGTVEGDPSLRYQLQRFTDDDPAGAVVVFAAAKNEPGAFAAIAAGTAHMEGHPPRYDVPRIVRTPSERYLLLKGIFVGNAGAATSALYRNDGGRVQEIDTTSWLEDLRQHLPSGLGLWRDVDPDYATMTAATALWRKSDGFCCPTGPTASIDLAIEDDRLVIKKASLAVPSGPARDSR